MSDIILSLKNVCKKYDHNDVANNISIDINNGEFVSLLGPSGCGKTTVLRMIGGFCAPDSGQIILDGKDITNQAPHLRDIGMVFQDYALWPHMTVEQHLTFGLKLKKITLTEINKRVQRVIDLVHLKGLEQRYPKQLSGGQQQRVALARSLIMEPQVLLLDEPLSNLDKKLRDLMKMELRRLQKKLGITMIFVTHDQSEALAISDRIVVMNKGSIIQQGSSYEIYENPNNIFVADFVGNANFFDAKIIEIEKEKVIVEIPESSYVIKLNLIKKYHYNIGDIIKIFIRPANVDILLEYSENEENILPAEYVSSIYEGSITRILVRIFNTKTEIIIEDASEQIALEEHQKIFIRLRLASLLPKE